MMLHDVISAEYLGGYSVGLVFDDGAKGTVDLTRFVSRGGVFAAFEDTEFFKTFRVDQDAGTLVWDGDIDIAPETLYAEATGTPLPDWMTPIAGILPDRHAAAS